MGDKVLHENFRPKKQPLNSQGENSKTNTKSRRRNIKLDIERGKTALQIEESDAYVPATSETRSFYERLLSDLQRIMVDEPQDVLTAAANELITSCRQEGTTDSIRKQQCEAVVGPLSDEAFTAILQYSKHLVDFAAPELEDDSRAAGDDTTGVAVVIDDDDDQMDEDGEDEFESEARVDDEREDSEEEGAEHEKKYLEAKHDEDDNQDQIEDKYTLDVSDIGPHWLQREMGLIFPDRTVAVATEQEILSILSVPDTQECENKLVFLLKYDNFEIAKIILRNRWKLLYCTRLGQAQSEKEKISIREEMNQTPEGREVLELLQETSGRRNRAKDFARSMRREAATVVERQVSASEEKDEEALNLPVDESLQVAPSRVVDLQSMAFEEEGMLMANQKVKLPEGTERIETKSYDEVVVPPLRKHTDFANKRRPLTDLPPWARLAFDPSVSSLNPVQSKVLDCAFNHYDRNMLICAPTGSGKTNVALLAMLNVINQYRDQTSGEINKKAFKILYISPMKALVAEQVASFQKRLDPLGLKVGEMTGDVTLSKSELASTQLIIATPEKWDIITRKSADKTFTQIVRLIILDEIHLIHDSRGPVLESIVARTIRHVESTQEYIRLVGLSATLPNYQDVALFMRVPLGQDTGLFVFGNEYRPVPLNQTIIGVKERKALKKMQTMNQLVYEKALANAGINQVLIFVHSRKDTVKTAKLIKEMAIQNDTLPQFMQDYDASKEILNTEKENIITAELKELLPFGFAVHHAGLPREDRKLVEDLFADRHIPILVSTATLAWGVNLPAHTVIVKGTQMYNPEKGAWTELSSMDVIQMMGRAGRPQYDTSGHGIIITNHNMLQYYLSLNNEQLPIESQMIKALPDTINSEVVLGSIRSRSDAATWLTYTYLFVRMLRNPGLYGLSEEDVEEDPNLLQQRVNIAHTAIMLLDKNNLVKYDRKTGHIQSTGLGRVASHYYVKYPTLGILNEQLKPYLSSSELIRLFSLSTEFKHVTIRQEEKVEFRSLLERVPIPVKGSIEDPVTKIAVLLQAYISKLKLESLAIFSDLVYVRQSASRIMRAIFEICLRRGWASLAFKALDLCKCIDRRMWNSLCPLRQFEDVPQDLIKKLERRDIAWDQYYHLTAAQLGDLIRNPKRGKYIHKMVHMFPRLQCSAYIQPISRTCIYIEVVVNLDFNWEYKYHGGLEPFWLFITDVDEETIHHHELFVIRESDTKKEITFNCAVPLSSPMPPHYYIRLVSDRWLQVETVLPVSFRELILPDKTPPHTELLDLQPTPIQSLKYPVAEPIFSAQFPVFNPFQTQTFHAVYETDDPCVICAPPASGLHICAELAICRMLKNETVRRCVYVVPWQSVANDRAKRLLATFGKPFGLNVGILTGSSTSDVKIMASSHIVICTPQQWDFLSRRWKSRKAVQQIRLFIMEDVHLIGYDTQVGTLMEIGLSRIRYVSQQMPHNIRIIATGNSVASVADLADWLGAGVNSRFNFHPNVRLVPLDVSIHALDVFNRQQRLLAMMKPVYQAVKLQAAGRPAIVFVADRREAKLLTVEMLKYTAAEGEPSRFRGDGMADDEDFVFEDRALKEVVPLGIAWVHETLSEADRILLERLFREDVLRVIISPQHMSFSLNAQAHTVVIQDTKRYDGHEKKWIDYSVADVLQMLGHASRPGIDSSATALLLCHSSKREFYKRYVFTPLPLESYMESSFPEALCPEIVQKVVTNTQDAVDWLTWTYYFRRLSKNPNFYGLQGTDDTHVSEHLSEVVESAIENLAQAECISVEKNEEGTQILQATNLAVIASFYYVQYVTVETFNQVSAPQMSRKALLEVLCTAREFEVLPIRGDDEEVLGELNEKIAETLAKETLTLPESKKKNILHFKLPNDAYLQTPAIKALLLIYAHVLRLPLTIDLTEDQRVTVEIAHRMCLGLIDVLASRGWFMPSVTAMRISQMLVQALNSTDSLLLQLSHFKKQQVLQRIK